MIVRKKKICTGCGREEYIFSKGRCKTCSLQSYGPIQKSLPKKNEKSGMAEFFQGVLASNAPFCKETGRRLSPFSHFNCCHIFPKRIYKSVATDPDNIIILSLDMHTRLDNLLDRMEVQKLPEAFPNSWPEMRGKIESLLPRITETNKLKIIFDDMLNAK